MIHLTVQKVASLVSLAVVTGCASTAPSDVLTPTARAELSCLLPSNCVNSLGDGEFVPLRPPGDAAQALVALQATLASFPEARVLRADLQGVEAVFATPIGFQDQVDFRIEPGGGRIDYRSRSLFGLFDFGKNRARMREFIGRFNAPPR